MKRFLNYKNGLSLLTLLMVVSVMGGYGQRRSSVRRTAPVYKVDAGTTVRVRMNDTISSKTAKVGDTFSTTVKEPVYSNSGVVVIPVGATITGRVNSVRSAQKGGNVGSIDADFTRVRLPNGQSRAINGSLSDLDSKSAKSDNEGTAAGDKTKYRKVIFIGGGGAGGAILGGAVGGGKGALIGGIIGGIGGLIAETQTKGEQATVKSGTEFGVRLNQAITLPKFSEGYTEETTSGTEYPSTSSGQTYIVRPGDTLSKISFRVYGTTARYMEIYEANRDKLSSPSNVGVGQELIIP